MPLPDGYRPREGDELLIRAKVKFNVDPGDSDVHVAPVGREFRNFVMPLDGVHSLHCRKWNTGDDVQLANDGRFPHELPTVGKVIAVDGDKCWVRISNGYGTYSANDLEAFIPAPSAEPVAELGLPAAAPDPDLKPAQ